MRKSRLAPGGGALTGPFYRIIDALMFLISAALLVQGALGLWRGWAIIPA